MKTLALFKPTSCTTEAVDSLYSPQDLKSILTAPNRQRGVQSTLVENLPEF